MPFQHFEYDNPFAMLTGGMDFGQNYLQKMRMNPQLLKEKQISNALNEYRRQMEEKRAPNYSVLAQSEADLARLAPQEHQQKMAELAQQMQFNPKLWNSQMAFQGAQTNKINTMTPLEAQEMK